MVLYPEVQKRAQEEIDSVLGHGHLPQFGDEDALPYVKAVLHEVLRWNPPAPLGSIREIYHPVSIYSRVLISGIPHRLTEDDVYNGYFIPAGSMVFYNTW
jgi:cytochrome P450